MINQKIVGLAVRIAGTFKDELLTSEWYELMKDRIQGKEQIIEFPGVSKLDDETATKLYYRLIELNKTAVSKTKQLIKNAGIDEAEALSEEQRAEKIQKALYTSSPMTMKQRSALIKLLRYTLGWTIEAGFSYVIETCPELRRSLTGWELHHSRITKLYSLMTQAQADKVIKRLDKIVEKNKAGK